MNTSNIKVATFYSFKGGAGRTVCAANFAGLLARKIKATFENPVLLVDLDLDSAGLTILLEKCGHYNLQRYSASGVISGALSFGTRFDQEEFLVKGLLDVSHAVGAQNGSVRFLGGELSARTTSGCVDAARCLNDMFEFLEEKHFSAVVVDSASGRQDIARALHRVSSTMVYCCRLTKQFLYGTEEEIKLNTAPRDDGDYQPDIIIFPTAVPTPSNNAFLEKYKAAKGMLFGLVTKTNACQIQLHEGIGEVESFKWMERVLVDKSNLAEDETKALQSFESLVDTVLELWSNE